MANKTKLELTWIGKDQRPRLEPRILLEDPSKSFHAEQRFTEHDQFDNRLIFGDNLLALKALEQEFTGKIKCVYIDPPFNTGQAMENYDDGLEHSIWLSLIKERLHVLHSLLADDGTMFVHIDDNELGYLIVLMDEIFGRSNRLYTITFRQGSATGHKSINPGCVNTTNFILIYSKNKSSWNPNRVYTARERDKRYSQFILNPEEDYRKWKTCTLTEAFARAESVEIKEARAVAKKNPEKLDEFVLKHADSVIRFARPDYKGVSEAARKLIDKSKEKPNDVFLLERQGYSDMYFKSGERFLFYRDKLKVVDGKRVAGEPLTTLWQDLLSNNLHKEGGVKFPKGKKPEALIKRVLEIATDTGDWVLDSFGGSGTTAAVAHKMGRRWITIELGEHCHTHISPRLQRLVVGDDLDGVSKAVGWRGGGGFRYFTLAPSLLEKDQFGNWIINKKYNKEMLVEALCKLEGFQYLPSESVYWRHGHSTENDFIYVTTQTLTKEQIQKLSDEVGPNRSLFICCGAFRIKNLEEFPNLTLKKIPRAVMAKCEWGKDDYSLEIKNLARAPEPEPDPDEPEKPKPKRRRAKPSDGQMGLFEMEGAE